MSPCDKVKGRKTCLPALDAQIIWEESNQSDSAEDPNR